MIKDSEKLASFYRTVCLWPKVSILRSELPCYTREVSKFLPSLPLTHLLTTCREVREKQDPDKKPIFP